MNMVVNSVAYRNGKSLGDVTIDDISEVLKQPDTFVWVGLLEPDLPFLHKIQEEFGLHELAIEDASKAHQRPKVEVYGDSLFIVVKTARLENGQVQYGETHIFAGKNFLITIRHGASLSYAQIRERAENNPKMLGKGPGFALYSIIDFIVDCYEPIMNQFASDFDRLEADILKGQFDRLAIERLYELKRQLLELRSAAEPMDEICSNLMRFHEEIIPKELRVYFRDIQDHARRVVVATANMREMLTTAMQVNLALVTVGQNEIVKRLAGWGAILAVPTVIFSLYGMNFEYMPELKWPLGYPFALMVTALCCLALHRKLKNAGWL
jgi:magnesium transporter